MSNSLWKAAACLAGALVILGVGYTTANPWMAAVLLPVAGLAAAVIQRERSDWLSPALLIAGISAAAGGVLLGASPRLMLAAASLLLVGWELSSGARQPFESISLGEPHLTGWSKGRLLVVSVGGGLLIAEAGMDLQVNLPFGVVLLAGLLVLFCLYRFSRISSKIPD